MYKQSRPFWLVCYTDDFIKLWRGQLIVWSCTSIPCRRSNPYICEEIIKTSGSIKTYQERISWDLPQSVVNILEADIRFVKFHLPNICLTSSEKLFTSNFFLCHNKSSIKCCIYHSPLFMPLPTQSNLLSEHQLIQKISLVIKIRLFVCFCHDREHCLLFDSFTFFHICYVQA